jgi:hypothetical protein
MRTNTLLAVLLLGCGSAVGEERGPCYGNGTCNAGLACLSGLCVSTADGGAADGGGADGGTIGCGGTFELGVPIDTGETRAVGPAVTNDELLLIYHDGTQVWESTRPNTTGMFVTNRPIAALTEQCTGTLTGVDISGDGLRVYVACGGLHQFHRSSLSVSAAFAYDGMVASTSETPAVVAGELELYDYELGALVHATRADLTSPFGTPTPLTSLSAEGDLIAPDLAPDGLTLYASVPTMGSSRSLVSYTRAALDADFDPGSRTLLGVEGGLNAGSPELASSCRSLYYSALDAMGVRIYVARR